MSNWERTQLDSGVLYTAEDSLCAIFGEYGHTKFEMDCPYWAVIPRYGAKDWRVEVQSISDAFIWAEGQ